MDFFTFSWLPQGGKIAFPPPSHPGNVVPRTVRATFKKQQTPQLWMKGAGEGCGFLCSLKLPYLSTSQQFCRQLCSLKGKYYNISFLHRLSFVMMGNRKMYCVERDIQWQVLTNKCNRQRMNTIRRMKRVNHADPRQHRQHNLRSERPSCTYSM